jgi:hypothetical protein
MYFVNMRRAADNSGFAELVTKRAVDQRIISTRSTCGVTRTPALTAPDRCLFGIYRPSSPSPPAEFFPSFHCSFNQSSLRQAAGYGGLVRLLNVYGDNYSKIERASVHDWRSCLHCQNFALVSGFEEDTFKWPGRTAFNE